MWRISSRSTLFVKVHIYALQNKEELKDNISGAQWLSGRVLVSRSRGCRFESLRRHCVVSLSKTH